MVLSIQANQTIRLLLTLSFIVMLSACGSSSPTPASHDFSSTGVTTTPTSSKQVVTCNKAGTSTLSYKIYAQVNANGVADPNQANVRVVNFPTGFEAGTSFVAFYKALANTDTTLSYANDAISFRLFDTTTNSYLNNFQNYTTLSWPSVKNLIPGSTPTSFASRVLLIMAINDPSLLYQVFTAASFTSSTSAQVESAASLLPTFYADPADYAIKGNGSARENILKSMHPFIGQPSTADFTILKTVLCQ